MSVPSTIVAAIAAGDPAADRVVYGIVISLIAIGVLLLGITVWLFRQTRVDPELLAPLERMSDRSWSRRDPATQRRMLDEVRPVDAVPLHREPGEPAVDVEFEQADRPVTSFDDLKDPVAEEQPDEQGLDAEESDAAGVEESHGEESDARDEGDDEADEVADEVDQAVQADDADEADDADHEADQEDEADADVEADAGSEAVSSGAGDPPGDGGADGN